MVVTCFSVIPGWKVRVLIPSLLARADAEGHMNTDFSFGMSDPPQQAIDTLSCTKEATQQHSASAVVLLTMHT